MFENRVKTSKMQKMDLDIDFANVNFYSFDVTEMTSYTLVEVSETLRENFLKFVEQINNSVDYFTYYSGNPLDNLDVDAENLINHSLGKFFIVGEKGRNYKVNELYSVKRQKKIEKDYLKHSELERYITKHIETYDDEEMTDNPSKNLRFLQAIVHLVGERSLREFNQLSTYFISTAVGTGNFSIAKDFAKQEPNSNGYRGFVIFGFEAVQSRAYVDSVELLPFLGKDKRYEEMIEKEQEIMIMQALFPRRIFGIFYWWKETLNFIINPWLSKKLCEGNLDTIEIDVNQELFDRFYKDLGYDSYTTELDREWELLLELLRIS